MLYSIRNESRSLIRKNFGDADKDRNGHCAASLIGNLRFFGIADFVLHHNVDKFRSQLKEAAIIREQVFRRIDIGEPIDSGYDTILSYQDVFNALASADFVTAESLASRVLMTPVRSDVHQFDEVLGRALCSVVTRSSRAQTDIDNLFLHCDSKDKDFRGYAEVFSAVLQKDTEAASRGLKSIILGHKRQTRGNGLFANSPDEVLAVWAVATANLAINREIKVISPDEELVPSVLLV